MVPFSLFGADLRAVPTVAREDADEFQGQAVCCRCDAVLALTVALTRVKHGAENINWNLDMFNRILPLSIAALLTLTGPVLAQDTTTQATDPAATTTEAAPAVGTSTAPQAPADLNMGTPLGPDGQPLPQVGEPYIKETFDDWGTRCLKAPEGQADPCQLYQLLKDKDGNNVAEFSIFPLAPGGQAVAGATIVAPLETLLTASLTIAVDGSAPRRYPFTFCNRAGCVARVGFTAEEVNQFKRGATATMSITPVAAPDTPVELNIGLKGFTSGFGSLSVNGQ